MQNERKSQIENETAGERDGAWWQEERERKTVRKITYTPAAQIGGKVVSAAPAALARRWSEPASSAVTITVPAVRIMPTVYARKWASATYVTVPDIPRRQ